jgi:diphthine-ammonia ligase
MLPSSSLHAAGRCLLLQVAALGLDPYKHLGRSLAALQPHLLRLADTYGCNPCGEGGEYETLTLDCPLFTAGRLELTDWQVEGPVVWQCM